ncbi:MAG: bifunctional 2-polyprenyl-6-hydroxyphenol methylase/3-demethylubiquinol 3-O-methyltransferase UbiG [Methylobacteriaceae bacterium]|nr:bifunctional 2-polyprenyl-6-hydroxyphenol methylase/3-demethylubiquinol 3-O-methyltransferase UbiG [Methylobacteriaceae bacterium]
MTSDDVPTPGVHGSVDPGEIAKFEALAKTWWDTKGPMRSLHDIHPLRVEFIVEQAAAVFGRDAGSPQPLANLEALDVGCAGGLVSESLARLGAKVTGIDPVAENVSVARRHAEESGLAVDYRAATLEETAAGGGRWDLVTALEVVEHVNDVPAFMRVLCSVVKPGGLLVMSTVNRTLQSFALAKVAAEYVLRWLPVGTHDWNRFVRPRELEEQFQANGLRVLKTGGIFCSPLTFTWHHSRDISVNYQIAARR